MTESVPWGNEYTYNPNCDYFEKFLGVCIHLENNFKSCREERCPLKKEGVKQ